MKRNFKNLFNKKKVRFCGIEAIDQKIVGFEEDKTYTIVSNRGMCALSFINSIFDNFNLLYDDNFSLINKLYYTEDLQNGDIMLRNIGSKFRYFELSEDVTLRDNHEKRPTLNDIPEHIQIKTDVIIALYRPEYYRIETWENPRSNRI